MTATIFWSPGENESGRKLAEGGLSAAEVYNVLLAERVMVQDKMLARAADMLNTGQGMKAMDLGNEITQFRRKHQPSN